MFSALASLGPQYESKIFSTSFSEKLRTIGGLTVEEFLHTPERNLPPIRYDIGFSNATSPWIYLREVKEELEPEAEESEEVEPAQKSTKIVCERVAEKVVQLSIPHSDESNPVRRTESYFNRWRPGKELQWFYYFNEPGAALRVQLTPNTFRIYCTPLDPTSSPEQMQLKYAQIAIDAGVLDFITKSLQEPFLHRIKNAVLCGHLYRNTFKRAFHGRFLNRNS